MPFLSDSVRSAWHPLRIRCLVAAASFVCLYGAAANVPGGGPNSGTNVTLVDSPDGTTTTMSNGIVTVVINLTTTRITSIKYANGSTTTETQLSSPGYYWGGFEATVANPSVSTDYGNGTYVYTRHIDPNSNSGLRADVQLTRTSPANIGGFQIHYTMQRGSPGFYTTAVLSHGAGDVPLTINAFGLYSSCAPTFNWLNVDPARSFLVGAQPTSYANHTVDAPKESNVAANGGLTGEFDNKFLESQDHAERKAWGFCSVGSGNPNIGAWTMTNMEFSDGGPLKRDVTSTPYRGTIANQILTQEVGQGTDSFLKQDEVWTKVCGPWFYYLNNLNNVSPPVTDPATAAALLYKDAVMQDTAEKDTTQTGSWPYDWCNFTGYTPAGGRGTVAGQLTLSDSENRNPTLSGTWVGVVQQPLTYPNGNTPAFYDFQKWLKPYQFWTQTDSGGHFTIPNVIAGSNYSLWAFGPGAAGTLVSQEQNGGSPLLEYTLPSPSGTPTPISVTVSAGQTTTVNPTWRPLRVGATVFELGVPDREEGEFRHGEDFWQAETPPATGFPSPIWGGQAYFPFEYPGSAEHYTVGTSRWDKDWNYVLPSEVSGYALDGNGTAKTTYATPTATITFNLAAAPAANEQASLYIGVAGCNLQLPQGGQNGNGIQFKMNGTSLYSTGSISAKPFAITTAGFIPPLPLLNAIPGNNPGDAVTYPGNYQDNSSIHLNNHGPFVDERIYFPGSVLQAGTNTLTITMAEPVYSNYVGLDYLRLELTHFVPPVPSAPTVYPGNARNLATWTVVPGAQRYNLLRKASSESSYTSLASGILGAVSGSDTGTMAYTDTTAVNGTSYTYEVQSFNLSGGYSGSSAASNAATPATSYSQSAPAAPSGVQISSSGHQTATVSWSRSTGAQYYAVSRETLGDDHNGGAPVLRTIVVDDYIADPTATFTDTTVSDGKIYDYSVRAFNAAGGSGSSALAMAQPLPPKVSGAPSVTATVTATNNVTLTWAPVANAIGYVVYRSNSADGPFTFPGGFRNSGEETAYTDTGLATQTTYYYQVTALNAAGISAPGSASAHTN